MITLNSINLTDMHEKCFAESYRGMCRLLVRQTNCRTAECKFYKPEGCKEWIRVEDKDGVNLVPPEEYEKYWRKK